MRIIEKGILDLTVEEIRQCKSLSLRHNGLMSEDLRDWKEYESGPHAKRTRRKTRIWLIKDNDDRLLAWAMCTPRYKLTGYDAQFYTRVSERGKGYGSLLMQKVLEYTPNPNVFPHDRTSGDFFKKHRDTIRFAKSYREWIEN